MRYRFLFDVPVYRCTEGQFEKGLKEQVNNFLKPWEPQLSEESFGRLEERVENRIRFSWRYNEIVGFIRVYYAGPYGHGVKIEGNLYLKEAKRLSSGSKAKIEYNSKILEYRAYPAYSSERIYTDIVSHLERTTKRPALARRYVNTEAIKALGPFIRWRALVGLEEP